MNVFAGCSFFGPFTANKGVVALVACLKAWKNYRMEEEKGGERFLTCIPTWPPSSSSLKKDL